MESRVERKKDKKINKKTKGGVLKKEDHRSKGLA